MREARISCSPKAYGHNKGKRLTTLSQALQQTRDRRRGFSNFNFTSPPSNKIVLFNEFSSTYNMLDVLHVDTICYCVNRSYLQLCFVRFANSRRHSIESFAIFDVTLFEQERFMRSRQISCVFDNSDVVNCQVTSLDEK